MPGRKFPSFIDAFRFLVLPKGAPEEFATWTALWCLSAAIERRAFTVTRGEQLYPNIFAFLVGPPGFGKGITIEPAKRIVAQIGKNRVSASSMTSASLVDDMRTGERVLIDKVTQRAAPYYAINVCSPELQVLLPDHDVQILGKLTDLYDCKSYSETRRSGKGENSFSCDRTFLSILGGTTPEHLFSTFPETAFKTGFFSRTVLVWGDLREAGDLFASGDKDEIDKFEAGLVHDLQLISHESGQFRWDDETKALANVFFKANFPYGGDPVPSHPRLLHYSTRRTQHLIKLMMLRAIDLGVWTFTSDIYLWAYDFLIHTEARMPEIFKEQAQGGETQTVNELHHEMALEFAKKGKPLTKARVYQLFGSRVQAYKIETLLDMAVTGGWLTRQTDKELGPVYIPALRRPTDVERKMK